MNKYTCAKCGCEIKDNNFVYCVIDCDGNRIDLCEGCYEKLSDLTKFYKEVLKILVNDKV